MNLIDGFWLDVGKILADTAMTLGVIIFILLAGFIYILVKEAIGKK